VVVQVGAAFHKKSIFEQHAAGAPEEQDVYSSSGLLTVGATAERDVLVSQAVTSRSGRSDESLVIGGYKHTRSSRAQTQESLLTFCAKRVGADATSLREPVSYPVRPKLSETPEYAEIAGTPSVQRQKRRCLRHLASQVIGSSPAHSHNFVENPTSSLLA
jgi:hypothetical protein